MAAEEKEVAAAAAPVVEPVVPAVGADTGAVEEVSAAAEKMTALLEAAKERGYDLSGRYADDDAALEALLETHKRYEQSAHLVEHGQRYVQHAPEFERWMAEQGARHEAEQAAKAKGWWNPPIGSEEYQRLLPSVYERDEAGQVRVKSGASPEAVARVQQAERYFDDWRHKVVYNPTEAFKPLVQQLVEPLIQQYIGAYAQQLSAHDVMRRNSDWMFDQAGKPTADGLRFRQAVSELEEAGVRDPVKLERMAKAMVRPDKPPTEKAKQEREKVLNRNRRVPTRTPVGAGVNGGSGAMPQDMDLKDALREALKDFSDDELE